MTMAQVDFYQLSRDPVERVVPLLATKALDAGQRVVVVEADPARRSALSDALWSREGSFIAHGEGDAPHAARQPVLLSADFQTSNGARLAILADGKWRPEAAACDRAILLFASEQTTAAQELWRALKAEGQPLRIFKQGEGGGWREGR